MKLHTDNHGFEGNLPEERIDMTIENSAKMFSILSDGIYKDKILAVIREYICNAYDAHVSVGKKETPFTVRLPSYLDTTFSVSDNGTGVDPKMIGKIFWTYGRSTKTDDSESIGALGLGSKSAFAYTKSSFIVKNRFNGTEYTYFCFINEQGTPSGSRVGEEPTTEPNGITVEFAVRPEDVRAFYNRFERIYKYWANVKPKIIGVDADDLDLKVPVKVVEGKDWYLEGCENSHERHVAYAIMGNVAYPIESASIPNLPASLKVIADNAFIVTFPLGDLEFAASRESLSYTEFTCKQLIKRLEEVRTELAKSFHDKVFAASKNHLSLYYTFAKTFSEFRKVVNIPSYSYGSTEIETLYTQLLLGKDQDDTVEFKGVKFEIDNLITAKYCVDRALYQNFGMYNSTTRGRSHRFFLEPSTKISANLIEEALATEFLPDRYNPDHKLKVGQKVLIHSDWRANCVARRSKKIKPSTYDLVLSSIDKFKIVTCNDFKIGINFSQLIFIINDVAGTGRDRFKSLVTNHRELNNAKLNDAQLVFVDYNPKVNKLEDVVADLKKTISATLSGATVKLLSDLPDVRTPIKKVKIDKESIKLKVKVFEYRGPFEMAVGQDYFDDDKMNIACDNVRPRNEEDKIFTLADLRSRKEVLFAIKRRVRSKLFDDVGSLNASCHEKSTVVGLASTFGFFSDSIVNEDYEVEQRSVDGAGKSTVTMVVKQRPTVPMLIINEGQHAYLVKKGVKLTSLTKMIAEKTVKLEETEKFTTEIDRLVTLSKVDHLRGMYEGLSHSKLTKTTEDWESSNSFFKKYFAEYQDLRVHGKKYSKMFAKLDLLNLVGKGTNVDYDRKGQDIEDAIDERYPLLAYTGYGDRYDRGEKSKALITYIEQIDGLIERALKEAAEQSVVPVEEVA